MSAAPATRGARAPGAVRGWIPLAMLVLLLFAIGAYTTGRSSQFLTSFNLNGLLIATVPLALVSMGQLVVLLVRYFDVSVGSTITFGVVVGSFVLTGGSWLHLLLGMAAILGIGLFVGLCNAVLIKIVGISAIITTLATLSVLKGLSLQFRPVPGGPISFDYIDTLTKSWGFMPLSFIGVLALAVVGDLWLYRTKRGLTLRAVGLDETSAGRLGKPSTRIQIAAFVACSLFAALASLFLVAQIAIGDPRIGDSYTLTSIAAPIVGGASFAGGRGSFLGAVAGSLFFYLIINILPFLNLSPAYGNIAIGTLTIIALIVYQGPALLARMRTVVNTRRRTRVAAAG